MKKIIFLLAFFISIIIGNNNSYAELPDVDNVVWNSDRTVSFTSVDGASEYEYGVSVGVKKMPEERFSMLNISKKNGVITFLPLEGLRKYAKEATKVYYIWVVAKNTNDEDISTFTSTKSGKGLKFYKLASPTNLRWDEKFAMWDESEDSVEYEIGLYEGDNLVKTIHTSKNRYSLSDYIVNRAKYYFTIMACSDNVTYLNSENVASGIYDNTITDDDVGEQPGEEQGKQPGEEQGKQSGEEQGKQSGEEQGKQPGEEQGEQPGEEQGKQPGEEQGEQPGEEQGKQSGEEQGKQSGEEQGKQPGEEQGKQSGEEQGKQSGEEQGKQPGEEQGKQSGEEQGKQSGEEQGEQSGQEQGEQKTSGKENVEKIVRIYEYLESTEKYSLNVYQSKGGSISPDTVRVEEGETQKFRIVPDDGYEIEDVFIDGKSVGKCNKYTFRNVLASHSIYAVFNIKEDIGVGNLINKIEINDGIQLAAATEIIDYEMNFDDVNDGDWYYDAVKEVCKKGLFSGISRNKFAPKDSITRGMLVYVLYKYNGKLDKEYTNYFSDIAEDAYYKDAINWAYENNIVSGIGNGKFLPNGEVSREQLAVILYNYYNSLSQNTTDVEIELNNFSDFYSTSIWARDAMKWAVCYGIISGRENNKLAPKSFATRAEVAAIFSRICQE